MNRRRLSFLLLVLVAINASTGVAETIPAIPLERLFAEAAAVASVQVVRGEMLGLGEDSCGAKYFALVEDGFKGAKQGDSIEFGHFYGYRIGSRYLLFLRRAGRVHEPINSINGEQLHQKQLLEKRCAPQWRRQTVMHSGFGAMEVTWNKALGYKDGVRVSSRYLVLPKGTKASSGTDSGTEATDPLQIMWVPVEEMSRVLRRLR